MTNKFFHLLRVALNTQQSLPRPYTEGEWNEMFAMSEKQTLVGVCMAAILRLNAREEACGIPDKLYWDWYGIAAGLQQDNDDVSQRSLAVNRSLRKVGFESCVLKGQGVAKCYSVDDEVDMTLLRQTGDIDVWIWPKGDWNMKHNERARRVVEFARKIGVKEPPSYHHIDLTPVKGTPVEAHYTPSWMHSPFTNRKLQRWFREWAPREMQHDFSSLQFNLVYMMVHLYRHLFREGIGLRQVVDYFFLLQRCHAEGIDTSESFRVLKSLGIGKFSEAVMWIIHTQLGLQEECLLCSCNEKEGRFLLSEIMLAGNFGQYDERLNQEAKNGSFQKFWMLSTRNIHFLTHYPSEVIWTPLWKIWHHFWIKKF